MVRVRLPNNWAPRDYQLPLWRYLEGGGKRAINVWHRRAGKDDVCLHWAACCAMQRPATYWHMLPEYAQGRKAIWTAVNPHTGKRRIDEAFPPEIRENTNDNEMFIRFKSGSTWQVVGSDRYDAAVGSPPAGITFSEWALANPSAWGYLAPILDENDGWALFITTSRGRNHAKTMLDMARNQQDWFAQVLTVKDTGYPLDRVEKQRIEYHGIFGEDIGDALIEQEYFCSFNAAILGAFYAREMVALRNDGRVREFEPVAGPVHRAWDIGVKDDTSIWWFQVIGGVPHIIDCYTNHGAGVDHYAEVIRERGWSEGETGHRAIDFVPHDAKVREWGTGRTRVESMQLCQLNPRLVPDATKMDGINAARLTLKKAVFHPRCEDKGIAALEQYRREWDDERKTFAANEVRDWTTHFADAFRYLGLAWRNVPAPEKPKPPLKFDSRVILPGPPVEPSGIRIRI